MEHQDSFNEKSQNEDMNLPLEDVSSDESTPAIPDETVEETPVEEAPTEEAPADEKPETEKPAPEKAEAPVKVPFTQHKLFKPVLIGAISLVAVIGIIVAIVLLGGSKDCSHEWSSWSVLTEATCLTEGTKTRKCTKCDETESVTISKSAHNLGELIQGKGATCADGTLAHHVCSVCQGTFDENGNKLDSVVVPAALAHSWVPGTCTTPKTCSVCNATEGDTPGHVPNISDPTCSAEQKCVNCGEKLADKVQHTPGPEATCTTAQTCTVCHDVINHAKNHTPGAAATCDTDQICTVCQAVIVPRTGHDYDDHWTTDGESHWHECHCGDKADLNSHTGGTATCTEKAKCEVCNTSYGAYAHSFTRKVVSPIYIATNATCDDAATYYYACEYCDEHNNETYTDGDPLGHAYGAWTYVDAETHKRVCGNDPAHVETKTHEGGEATCTEKAICEVCNSYYGDEPSHNWGDGEVLSEPDCENDGLKKYTCSECTDVHYEAITSPGHDFVHDVTEPTCGEGGYTTHTCQVCEYYYIDSFTDATGVHNLPTRTLCTEDLECADCDYVEIGGAHNHQVTGVVNATCTTLKTTTYTCSKCTHTYSATEGDYAPHTFTASITTEATCDTTGLKTYTCAACGYSQDEEIPTNNSHTWNDGVTVGNITTYTCTVCVHATYTAIVTTDTNIDVNADDLQSAGNVDLPDASLDLGELLEDGEALAGKDVNISAEKLNAEDVLTPEQMGMLGEQTTVYNFTIKEGNEFISNFNDKYVTVTLPYTPKPGEDVDSIAIWCIKDDGNLESFAATYANGYVTFRTNHFSYYTVTSLTPAEICELTGEHNYQPVPYTGKTCGDENYILQTCTRCGYAVKEDIEIITHNYESVVTEPTCTEDGKTVYTCTNCGDSYETPIYTEGHSFTETRVEASCTVAGYVTLACAHCDVSYTTTIPKLAHSLTDTVVAPTCESRGYTTHACECGLSYTDSYVPATGHDYEIHFEWSDDLSEALLIAICNNDDSHMDGAYAQITVYENNPTCQEHYVVTYIARATFGGTVHTDTREVTGDLGEHYYSTSWSSDENTHWHACLICGEKADESEHSALETKVVTAATCTTTGILRSVCECGAREDEIIPALDHDIESTIIAPTCDREGYTLHSCTRCEYSYTDTTVPAIGHSYTASFTWNGVSGATLVLTCENNAKHVRELQAIINAETSKATCITPSVATYTATVDYNGTIYTDVKTVTGDLAPHTFGTVLKYDSKSHWYECIDCGAKDQATAHTYGEGKVISAATCIADGVMVYNCSCEYEKSETIPATGNHTYVNGVCTGCGKAENSCDHTVLTTHIVDLHKEYGACEETYIVYESCECGEVKKLLGESFEFCDHLDYEERESTESEYCERYDVTATCSECNLYFEGYSEEKVENCAYVYGIVITVLRVGDKTVCENVVYEEVEDEPVHIHVTESVINLADYGACEGTLVLSICDDCGALVSMEEPELTCDIDVENLDEETLEDGSIRTFSEQTCSKCGLYMSIDAIYLDGNCTSRHAVKFYVAMGDTVITDCSTDVSMEDHSYNSSNYKFELTGDSCQDLYRVIAVCSDCGHEEFRYYGMGHRDDNIYLDLSQYGICGITGSGNNSSNGNIQYFSGSIYTYGCSICGKISSDYYVNLYNCKMQETLKYDEATGMSTITRTCLTCGIVVTTSTRVEAIDRCNTKHYGTIEISRGGTVLFEDEYEYDTTEHTTVCSFELKGESCADGFKTNVTCAYCDYTYSYSTSSSEHYEGRTYYYEAEGACGNTHRIEFYSCACGKQSHSYYDSPCESCGIEIIENSDSILNGCVVTVTKSFAVKIGGETVYSFGYDTSYDDHSYTVNITDAADGSTVISVACSVCGHTKSTTVNNANLEYFEDGNEYHYDFEYTPTANGTYVIYSLANRDTYVTLYKYVNGSLERLVSDDDGANNNGNFRLEYDLEAGVTYVYRIRFYTKSDSGTIPFVFVADNATCSHDHNELIHSILAPGAVDCEGGRQSIYICTACGNVERITTTTYHEYEYKSIDLTNLGACYGSIEYEECVCGKVSNVWYNSCAYNYYNSYYTDDNGVYHNVDEYSCTQCGLVIKRDAYEVVDGCHYYNYSTYTISVDGSEKLVIDSYSYYQSHNYEVSYTLRGESCNDGVDYVYTCRDCGYSYNMFYTWHSTQLILNEELGGCGGTLTVYECPCKQQCRVEFYANCYFGKLESTTYEENGITYYVEVGTCEKCGLSYTRKSWNEKDGCNVYTYNEYTITKGDEVILDAYKYLWSTYTVHEYEITFEMNGDKCYEGFTAISTCVNCGYESSGYYEDHATFLKYSFNPNDYEGCCGDKHYFRHYACPCGEKEYFDYYVYDCSECGFVCFYEENTVQEGCNLITNYTAGVKYGDEVLYSATNSISVVNHIYEANITENENGETVIELVCSECGDAKSTTIQTVDVEYKSDYGYCYDFVFVPETDGYYLIYSISDRDTRVELYVYDEYGSLENIGGNDDGGYDSNFYLRCYLEAGRTYVFRIGYYSECTDPLSFVLTSDTECYHGNSVWLDRAPANGNCEEGIQKYEVCTGCGEIIYTQFSYEHRYESRYYDLSRYGACYGELYVYECTLCGNVPVDLWNHCWDSENYERVTVDGIEHEITTYHCDKCDLTVAYDSYYIVENCYRYYRQRTTVDIGDIHLEGVVNYERYEYHTAGEGEILREPTCYEVGEMYGKCTVCGLECYMEIPKTEHSWVEEVYPGDCWNQGYTHHWCDMCGEWYDSDYTDPAHNLEIIEVVPPSCNDGYTEYYCNNCGQTIYDDYVPATGEHIWESEIYEPDCWSEGYTHYWCTSCGESYYDDYVKPEHDYQLYNVIEPTCNNGGYSEYYCSRCGSYEERDHVEPTGEHVYESETFEADCWNDGYTYYWCIYCYEGYHGDYVKASHDYELVRVVEPTCISYGYTEYNCSRCGSYEERDHVEPTGEHDLMSQVYEPDCWNSGYTYTWCNNCGYELYDNYVDAAHDYYVVDVVEPTCNNYGWTTYQCSICGYYEDRDHIKPTGVHEFEYQTSYEGNEYIHGYTEYYCRYCGVWQTGDYVTPEGHVVVVKAVIEPDCLNGGHTSYYCETCGFAYDSDYTPIGEHAYDIKIVKPTCRNEGYTIYSCKFCGDYYESDYTPVTDHVYTEQVVEATCENDGYTLHTCRYCKDSYEDNVTPAFGHDFTTVTREATCTVGGYVADECSRCGANILIETTPPLGHQMELVEAVAPTCADKGYDLYECVVCHEQTTDNYVDSTGEHSYSDGFCIWCGRDENYVCDHILGDEIIVDLSQYGACENTYLIYRTCECGEVKELATPESIFLCEGMAYEYEMSEGENEAWRITTGHCRLCGISVVGELYGILNGCVVTQSFTVKNLCIGDLLIADAISYSMTADYHENIDTKTIYFAEHGACGGSIDVEYCVDCDKITNVLDMHLDCDISLEPEIKEDEFGGAYAYVDFTCEKCGLNVYLEGYELSSDCGYVYEMYVVFTDMYGNVIVEVDMVEEDRYHEYDYDYVLYGDGCNGLYKAIGTCKYCGETQENYCFNQHLMVYEEHDLGKYGCNGYINGEFCAICGRTTDIDTDMTCQFETVDEYWYNDEEGNTRHVVVVACSVCGLTYEQHEWTVNNSCYEGEAAAVYFKLNDFSFVYYDENVREFHNYQYDFIFDGKTCEDGVTINAVCTDCGDSFSVYTYGHYEIVLDCARLSEFGCCNHYYIVRGCPCGENQYEDFDTMHCEFCGYEAKRESDSTSDGCYIEMIEHVTGYVHGKEVFHYEYRRETIEHSYTVTSLIPSGTVYFIATRCENCGEYKEGEYTTATVVEHEDGCYYEYFFMPSQSGNYVIYSVSDKDTYVYLGYYDENGVFRKITANDDSGYNLNFQLQYYLEANVAYVYRIHYFGADECGEFFFTLQQSDEMCSHNYGSTLSVISLPGTTCEDGIFNICACCACGDVIKIDMSYEHNAKYFEINLSQYGVCSGTAYGSVCECGEGYVNVGFGCDISAGVDERTEYTDENGDRYVVITSSCSNCNMYHYNEYRMTVIDCVEYTYVTHKLYVNNSLVYESYSHYREVCHNIVKKYPEIDNCLDGYELASVCVDCGYSTSVYFDHHAPVETVLIEVEDHGLCGDGYVKVEKCACGLPEGCAVNYNLSGCTISYRYDYYTDDFGYSHSVDIMYCEVCGMEAHFDKYIVSEGCTNYTYEIFSFVAPNGETLVDPIELLYMKSDRHDMQVIDTILDGPTCEYGYTLIYSCKACGIESESYRMGHSYKYETVIDLSEIGACGAQLVVNACPCGQEGTVKYVFGDCVPLFREEMLEDVDGNSVYACYYDCADCSVRVEMYRTYLAGKDKHDFVILVDGNEIYRHTMYS